MKQLQVNRRQFMQAALSVACTISVGQFVIVPSSPTQHPLLPHLAALLPHQQSARLIGQHYLQHHPQEAQVAHLLAALVPASTPMELAALRQHMASQISTDFATDRVVKLQGWVLSCTEARLCALAYLFLPK